MPNKTIYVSEDDQPLYQRAQELAGGNLSAAISGALRRYVDADDARNDGYEEIILRVGIGAGRKVRFLGVLLGEWFSSQGERYEHHRIYRGSRGRYAVHVEHTEYFDMRDADGNPLTGWRAWTGIGMASGGGRPAEATLDVYDTIEDMRDHVRPELYEMAAASVKHSGVEDLDL